MVINASKTTFCYCISVPVGVLVNENVSRKDSVQRRFSAVVMEIFAIRNSFIDHHKILMLITTNMSQKWSGTLETDI